MPSEIGTQRFACREAGDTAVLSATTCDQDVWPIPVLSNWPEPGKTSREGTTFYSGCSTDALCFILRQLLSARAHHSGVKPLAMPETASLVPFVFSCSKWDFDPACSRGQYSMELTRMNKKDKVASPQRKLGDTPPDSSLTACSQSWAASLVLSKEVKSMGREIRRVPLGWEHPRQRCAHSPWAGGCDDAKLHGGQCFQPLYDKDFESAMKDWLHDLERWLTSEFAEYRAKYPDSNYDPEQPYRAYCEWYGTAPDPEYYRPVWKEANAYQMYETVSEGTPVSPVFETPEGLVDYLVNHGDFWDQYRGGKGGWSRENAEAFVGSGWAPSLMVIRSSEGVEIKSPRDGI